MPRIGRYEVEDASVPTGWGPRHRGVDLSSDAPVDVYQVANARYGGFARASARQVVRTLDLVETEQDWWLVTERLAGAPLHDVAELPAARAQWIFEEVRRGLVDLRDVGLAHGRLAAETVVVSGDRVALVEMALDGDPRDDVFRFADLVWRHSTDAALREVLAPCLAEDPDARPLLERVILPRLRGGEEPEPRARFAAAAGEDALLDQLRARPDDVALRIVYSDWLLERGEVARAKYVRDSLDAAGEPMWRAVVSARMVERCAKFGAGCPRRWVELAPTDDDRMRVCDECERGVYYCTTRAELRAREMREDAVVIDEALG